jgi:hypothetical protein
MNPYIKTIQDSLKIGEGPTHRDEDQILDNKEQNNCLEETQEVDENDIAKFNLPCDEGKGENCHRPMIWQQLGNEISSPFTLHFFGNTILQCPQHPNKLFLLILL